MLRWPIRLATVVLTAAVAYGWGDFATEPGPLEAVLLIALTVVLVASLQRLYRPGGLAAFEWDEERERRAPGEPVRPRAVAEPSAQARPPAPRDARPSGSLWSSDRDP